MCLIKNKADTKKIKNILKKKDFLVVWKQVTPQILVRFPSNFISKRFVTFYLEKVAYSGEFVSDRDIISKVKEIFGRYEKGIHFYFEKPANGFYIESVLLKEDFLAANGNHGVAHIIHLSGHSYNDLYKKCFDNIVFVKIQERDGSYFTKKANQKIDIDKKDIIYDSFVKFTRNKNSMYLGQISNNVVKLNSWEPFYLEKEIRRGL